jgi:tetratricopeptide (TPR) repeat protein
MKFGQHSRSKIQGLFSFLKVMRYFFRAAAYIGRKDYDEAIEIMSKSLVGSKQDVGALEMIAKCHHWAERDDLAIETAKKALVYDPTSFDAIQVLSTIFALHSDRDNAATYIRVGLNNVSDPIPEIPRSSFCRLRFLGKISPCLKRLSEQAEKDLGNLNQSREEWKAWAENYLAWYDATYTQDRHS